MAHLKFAPGPWRLHEWTSHDIHGAIEACGMQVVDADGRMVSAGAMECPSIEEEANLSLIAAAPELLEALQGLIDAHAVPSSACKERPAYNAARKAISKALGEQP